jgi:acetolactate decarboxylase
METFKCSVSDALAEELRRAVERHPLSLDEIVGNALSEYLRPPGHTLFQVSTSGALVAGIYQGAVSTSELLRHGDLGLGTFEGLDGEMVVLDGRIYQVHADGSVQVIEKDLLVPFAAVLPFASDNTFEIPDPCSLRGLQRICDGHRRSRNVFYAFRIDGVFASVHTRAMRAVSEHTTLLDAASVQPEFHFQNVSGTIVGLWSPGYAAAFNVPGYHFHFISDDRMRGGHLLDFTSLHLELQVDAVSGYYIALPQTEDFLHATLPIDPTSALYKAE